MTIYVKYAKSYFPSNYVTEWSDKPLSGYEELEIESVESFLQNQDVLIKAFMAEKIQPVVVEEEVVNEN